MGKPKKHQSSDTAADELNLETVKDEGELVSIATLKQMLDVQPSMVNLAKSIPESDKSHRSFLNGGFINSFFLQSASEQQVTEICSSFRSGTAPAYDSISMNAVKESFNLICAPLT